jgi:hypothetical protein
MQALAPGSARLIRVGVEVSGASTASFKRTWLLIDTAGLGGDVRGGCGWEVARLRGWLRVTLR